MSRSVLVVDDCGTTRKLISFLLKKNGYNAVYASNGIEAIEKLAASSVDVVLTDLNMPQMDGLALIMAIRNDGKHKDMPVIMLTSEASELDHEMAKRFGVNTYLVKPVTQERLVSEIEKLFLTMET